MTNFIKIEQIMDEYHQTKDIYINLEKVIIFLVYENKVEITMSNDDEFTISRKYFNDEILTKIDNNVKQAIKKQTVVTLLQGLQEANIKEGLTAEKVLDVFNETIQKVDIDSFKDIKETDIYKTAQELAKAAKEFEKNCEEK